MSINPPQDLKKIDALLQEISNIKTKIEINQDTIKDIITSIHEEYAIEKSLIRKLAKVYHVRNFIEEVAVQDEFIEMYESLTSINNKLN